MADYIYKRITDPVHGTIGLSKVEAEIISTPVFQRLRNIKQLGLANLVFPGADYSRFSHSIGVCHVTGRILENLERNKCEIGKKEIQQYRLAGLLHDIGHYPFSHAMEHAISNFFAKDFLKTGKTVKHYNHGGVGKLILETNKDIRRILKAANIKPDEIYKIFNREEPPRFANLVSSDMDADRIDYMMRTAHHTGLPYGLVDLNYLLSQLRVDKESRLCLTPKALRTAEHFLLGRYFDYQQVAFHKTVVSMEWLLNDLIMVLLERKKIRCSAKDIENAIEDGTWNTFDDTKIMEEIRGIAEGRNSGAKDKALAIVNRRTPKLLCSVEYFDVHDEKTRKIYRNEMQSVKEKVGSWSKRFGIPLGYWHLWEPKFMTLTKSGSLVPISTSADSLKKNDLGKTRDGYEEAVRIMVDGNSSVSIMEQDSSLIRALSNSALYSFRLYVLSPADKKMRIDEIRKKIKTDLPNLRWK